jgi:AcrR family transcriptional regulator
MARVAAVKVEATRTSILDAARSVLRGRGYASLSTREVAAVAGVPLSQIHYHFGSKQGLLVALLEYLNEQLLTRQHRMFHNQDLTLSQQWDLACDYLDEDLASGYVRVLQELWAAGWSDPEVAKVVRHTILGWVDLLAQVVRHAETRLGPIGPFTPEEVATLICNTFIGAEAFLLLGLEEQGTPIRPALRRVGETIRMLEEKHR